jgi:hypothetical protein
MAGNINLTDLAKPQEETEKEGLSGAKTGQPAINPYSYEHRISLDDNTLTKLGMGTNTTPKVGDTFMVHALATVHSVSSHQDESSKGTSGSRHVGLQFKKMGMKPTTVGGGSVADAVNEGIQQADEAP